MRLLDHLQELAEYGPQDESQGICAHLHPADIPRFRILVQSWPEYSGDPRYPVPTPPTHEGVLSAEGAFSILPKWHGKYGAARRRLLDWTIGELQHALQN